MTGVGARGSMRGGRARVVVAATAVAALVVAVVLLLRGAPARNGVATEGLHPAGPTEGAERPPAPEEPSDAARAGTREPVTGADRPAPPDARDALGAIDPALAWRAQVGRAVERIARERLGRSLAPADEARLLDALKSVGPAARGLDREELDPDDPASIARVREQTATLVEADRVSRDLLGVGVAELLRLLDPSAIEDRGGATG